jgi:autotransporter translocation and assembly factor TamB
VGRNIIRVSSWIIVGLALLIVLVVIGVGFYTQTEGFRVWLKEQAVAALQPSVKGEIRLERVSGSLWTVIELHNVSIDQDGVEVLTIPQVNLTVHLLPQLSTLLWSRSLHIAALQVTGLEIKVFQDPEGTWNLARLFDISDEPQDPILYFDRLTVTGGRVDIRQATNEETQLTDLSLAGNLALLANGMQVNLTNLDFSLVHPKVPKMHGVGSLWYDDTISPPQLRLQDFHFQSAHSQVQVSGTVHNLAAPDTELTVTINPLAAAEVRTLFPSVPLQEDLSGSVHLTGPLSALQINATFTVPNGQTQTSGTVNLTATPPEYQGQLEVERLALDKVLQIPNVAGEVRGRAAFTGTGLEPTQAHFQASASGLLVHGWSIDSVELTGDLSKDQLAVQAEVRGKSGNGRIQSQVTLGRLPSYEGTIVINNLDVARVTQEQPQLTGQLNLDAWVKGAGISISEMDSSAKITLRPSQIGPVSLTRGEAAGTLRHGQLTVERLTLLANDTSVTAQGTIGKLGNTPDGTISYTLDSRNITPWLALVGGTGAGQLRLQGTLSGDLSNLRLEGQAAAADLRLDSAALQSGRVTWKLTGVGSERPSGQVTAALAHLNAGLALRTVTANLALVGAQPLAIQAKINAQADEQHALNVETLLRYDSQRVDAQIQALTLQLPSGSWRAPQQAQVLFQSDTLTISALQLQRGEQKASIAGVVTRRGAQDLRAQVQRFPFAELRPFLADDVPQVGGYISADVSIQGTAASPEIAANLTIDELVVAEQVYAGLTAQGTYQQEYLRLNALLRQDQRHTLSLEGGLPVSLSWAEERVRPVLGEADLRVRSEGLNLAFLGLLSKEVREVQGTVSMEVRVGGTLDALSPSGAIRVQHGQARIVPLGIVVKDIEVQLGLSRNTIQVDQLAIGAGQGRVTGAGTLTVQQYTITALDLAFDARRFRVINTREYTAAVSGRVTCSGSLQSPLFQGTLTLRDTTLRPDLSVLTSGPVAPDPTILVVKNEQELPTPAQLSQRGQQQDASQLPFQQPQSQLYQRLRLDLAVAIPRDTWVQMHDGSIELMGQLQIRKNPTEDAIVSGQIETVRGWYAFYGRQFQIEKGQVTFTGSSRIDPNLDVIARYTLPQYKVDVVIGGTADSPTLTLRSDPSLEQADILSLLVFGKPANALSQGEKVSLQTQALQATAGFIAADLRQSIAQELGIDTLEFDIAERRFGAGKYVTKDVFVSTSQQFGHEQKQEVAIEYQLDTNWQIKATTSAQGESGIDLFWQKQY